MADDLVVLVAEICPNAPLDMGIVRAVKALRDAGIHTVESGEGGAGHAFADPTVKIHGTHGDGWRALAVCMDHRLPVVQLNRAWAVTHGEVDGPYWEIVFGAKLD